MEESSPLQQLLRDCVDPVLQRSPLLASPDDARQRDNYVAIFSLETLLSVAAAETQWKNVFIRESERVDKVSYASDGPGDQFSKEFSNKINAKPLTVSLVEIIKKLKLVPQVLKEEDVQQLINDILPRGREQHTLPGGKRKQKGKETYTSSSQSKFLFPQWQWTLAVVSLKTVEAAVRESGTLMTDKVSRERCRTNLTTS